jgi:hypothetical protein
LANKSISHASQNSRDVSCLEGEIIFRQLFLVRQIQNSFLFGCEEDPIVVYHNDRMLLKLEIKKITTEYKANIPAFDVAVYIKIV